MAELAEAVAEFDRKHAELADRVADLEHRLAQIAELAHLPQPDTEPAE